MSRNHFNNLSTAIRLSDKPVQQGEQSSVRFRWSLVSDFAAAINHHRKSIAIPSEVICVDESISRWYGLGGHWIDIGLPNYVANNRNQRMGGRYKMRRVDSE
jgi:hypothetical protein